ncbi:ABC transporter permease [Chitinophaga barathri]|uniref:ABC transporter permease n=1 Tax=Chitinophaga barathri TaxID=1647451 RepID=A0A3N4MBQ7_9BACT|nr:ABC transporter permease [Chitinophaga barathri]RPD41304.1 hypothetical protein EG028_11545 [Chitinophaga barathri]
MIKLLKIEWLKVKAYRTFWILSGLFLIAVPLLMWAFESIIRTSPKPVAAFLNSMSFPKVWDNTAWLASWVTPVMGILLVIFLTNENNFRTIRQNIIDGWSRDQYITAKYGVLVSAALFMTLVISITALVFGLRSGDSEVSDGSIFIWYTFVQSLTYLSLAFFLGVYMKRAGIAIAIYVMYVYIGEFAISMLLEYKVAFHSGTYLPLESTDRLIGGESKILRDIIQRGGSGPSRTTYIIIAFVWIFLFNGAAWYKMKKADL